MRWRMGRRSRNIEDRRGAGFPGGGSPRRMRLPRGRIGRAGGIGGVGAIVVVLIAMFLGVDPSLLLQGVTQTQTPMSPTPSPTARSGAQDELTDFVSVVLGDTEDTWHALFADMGGTYQEPTLVLFSGAVESACGYAQAAVGPFYCPGDQQVYIDLGFFEDLADRFGAPGDFAQAYVLAHEVGHHVQTLLGISEQVHAARAQLGETEGNALSVMQELQADCFAGVWAHHAHKARQILEQGDVEEALGAATSIGDDHLQRQAQGYVVPESFTHGSSAQRVRWFRTGLSEGTLQSCDTFGAERL